MIERFKKLFGNKNSDNSYYELEFKERQIREKLNRITVNTTIEELLELEGYDLKEALSSLLKEISRLLIHNMYRHKLHSNSKQINDVLFTEGSYHFKIGDDHISFTNNFDSFTDNGSMLHHSQIALLINQEKLVSISYYSLETLNFRNIETELLIIIIKLFKKLLNDLQEHNNKLKEELAIERKKMIERLNKLI